MGRALVGRFSDGEVRIEIHENVRGMEVYVIQSTCPPANENLIELLVLIDALKRASAKRVNVVIPYYGYGRQDQKEKPRVSITARMVADLLTVAGASRLITVDLHASQIQGFLKIPVEDLDGLGVMVEYLKESLRGGRNRRGPRCRRSGKGAGICESTAGGPRDHGLPECGQRAVFLDRGQGGGPPRDYIG